MRAQLAGLTSAEFDACLADQDLLKGIQAAAAEAQKRDGIESTPTFFINGKKISGAASTTGSRLQSTRRSTKRVRREADALCCALPSCGFPASSRSSTRRSC